MSDAKYCPHCGQLLSQQQVDGRERPSCALCGYVFWDTPVPVVAAIVEREGSVLLARKREWPPGRWALFAGFPEAGETMEEAILREVHEEADLEAKVLGLIGVYSLPHRNQVFIVYRLSVEVGEVNVGEELEAIRAFRRDELAGVLEHLPPEAGAARALRDWLQIITKGRQARDGVDIEG
jgi:NADH pyrophosphatase NudC (nudix superfamily)